MKTLFEGNTDIMKPKTETLNLNLIISKGHNPKILTHNSQ